MGFSPGGTTTFTDGLEAEAASSFATGSKPICLVRMSADQTGIVTATPTKVAFNTVVIDTNSAFNTSLNRYVVPIAGIYRINSYLVPNGFVSGVINIRKNGSDIARVINEGTFGIGTRVQLQISYIEQASVSDYFEIFYTQNSGANRDLNSIASGAYYPTFFIEKLN